jgi:hypothetical protein
LQERYSQLLWTLWKQKPTINLICPLNFKKCVLGWRWSSWYRILLLLSFSNLLEGYDVYKNVGLTTANFRQL